jgi:hypothetical protein
MLSLAPYTNMVKVSNVVFQEAYILLILPSSLDRSNRSKISRKHGVKPTFVWSIFL